MTFATPSRSRALVLGLMLTASFARADDYKLETLEALPEGLAPAISASLSPPGYRVIGGSGPWCEVWLAKEIPTNERFTPTLNVKYPLTSGQFIGTLNVPRGTEFADFRGQTLQPGLYMLRYGQQPQDGNHVGTSDTSDFLVALGAKEDQTTAAIESVEKLQSLSAQAAGTSHPAIFSLLPPENDVPGPASLIRDEAHDFWILKTLAGQKRLVLRLVVAGRTPE